MQVSGTGCWPNYYLHQKWGEGKKWKEENNDTFQWLLLGLFRESFSQPCSQGGGRISFLGCETQILLRAKSFLQEKPVSFLCLKMVRTLSCFVYQLLDSLSYCNCQECRDWVGGWAEMEKRLKQREWIIRNACINEIVCWQLGNITEQCKVQTDRAKLYYCLQGQSFL